VVYNYLFPPESATAVFYDPHDNIWMNEDGEVYNDLKEFGFTALQRNTILKMIFKNFQAGYICVLNNFNEFVEIMWGENT
jgi:hypothetical protein